MKPGFTPPFLSSQIPMPVTTEHREALLTALVEEARVQGANLATLRALVEEASEQGASRALSRLGLHDDAAVGDIRELRDLLDAWHATRRTAWHTLVRWTITLLVSLVLAAFALKLRVINISG